MISLGVVEVIHLMCGVGMMWMDLKAQTNMIGGHSSKWKQGYDWLH